MENALQQIFHIDSPTPCHSNLRKGLEELGIYHYITYAKIFLLRVECILNFRMHIK